MTWVRQLPREVAGVIRRHPWVAVAPAALLGAGADGLVLLRQHVGAQIALGLLLALIFDLYVAYAELVIAADGEGRARPGIADLARRALPFTPALLLASAVAIGLPIAATGLLIIPGLWLLTRWSLFAPAIVHEGLRPRAALARSNALVRGAFWAVACTATLALLIEHAIIHATVYAAEPAGWATVVGLAGAAVAAVIVSPAAAFTISLVYEHLEHAATAESTPAPSSHAPAQHR